MDGLIGWVYSRMVLHCKLSGWQRRQSTKKGFWSTKWPSYCRKSAVDLFLLKVQMTPSSLFLRLPWYSERSVPALTSLSKEKKVHWGYNQQIGRLADHLDAFAAIKSLGLRWLCILSHRPFQKLILRQSQNGPFQLESWLGRSQSLWDENCIGCFAAGLSKGWRWQQPWYRWSFL